MASRIIFDLDDQGSIVSVTHEANHSDPHPDPAPTTDEASLSRKLLTLCGVVDIETLLRTYPTPRLIRVATYALWKQRRGEIRGANPSGFLLTVLRRKSEVPDVESEILESLHPTRKSTIDHHREEIEQQRSIDLLNDYLKRRGIK